MVYQPNGNQLNPMDRWNELIAGFVLGNLTPEESESVAKILAENPQLARNIVRLRNTATVRPFRPVEWTTSRSQDGLEGWADTASDLPGPNLQSGLANNRFSSPRANSTDLQTIGQTARHATKRAAALSSLSRNSIRGKKQVRLDPVATQKPDLALMPRSEKYALAMPLSNPLWWMAICFVVAAGIDNLRVRQSLSLALEEISRLSVVEPSSPAD